MTRHEVLRAIISDCARLAYESDNMPFTGKSVGTLFGELFAMVATLAQICLDDTPPKG